MDALDYGVVLYPRAGMGGGSVSERPPIYKTIGIILAICSGVFIGTSFVMKKKGLLAANLKDGTEAGEGYGYLKNFWWWGGMGLMAIGEICNFAAYLFVEAILVTPLGALSVVITAILSSIFLKERLSFVGKIGCAHCILGSVVIVLNAPKQPSASTIEEVKDFVLSPGFLSYAGIVIVGCIVMIVYAAPRWGNKSMLVYLSVCSLIGGLNVVAIQGLGVAITAQARGISQFKNWFTYLVLAFVIVTLAVEIIYLNKALNIFNAALVTPTYYVFFTTATIVSSAILFRGFKGGPIAIITMVLGFLQICCGVILLQLSKSAKNVPDTEIFTGDLDQVHTIAEQEEPESEPKADAIRGAVSIVRRFSVARQAAEAEELRRIMREKEEDLLHPPLDGQVQWDGVRRRVSFTRDVETGQITGGGRRRSNTTRSHRRHPPLGLTRIPDEDEEEALQSPTVAPGHSRRRSMSLDAGMVRPNLLPLPSTAYEGARHANTEPSGLPQHNQDLRPQTPDTVWSRTKSLFTPKLRSPHSQTTLQTPSSPRPRPDSSRDALDVDDEKIALDELESRSPPRTPTKRHYRHASSDSNENNRSPSPPQTPSRREHRTLLSTPKSSHSAVGKRTLSFNVFGRGRSSENVSGSSGSRNEGGFGAPSTEEEALGLVRGGSGSGTIRPVRTEYSEDDRLSVDEKYR